MPSMPGLLSDPRLCTPPAGFRAVPPGVPAFFRQAGDLWLLRPPPSSPLANSEAIAPPVMGAGAASKEVFVYRANMLCHTVTQLVSSPTATEETEAQRPHNYPQDTCLADVIDPKNYG